MMLSLDRQAQQDLQELESCTRYRQQEGATFLANGTQPQHKLPEEKCPQDKLPSDKLPQDNCPQFSELLGPCREGSHFLAQLK